MATLTDFQKQQLACSYATLLLADAEQSITSDSLAKLTEAAGITVEKFFLDAFARVVTPEIATELVDRVSKVGAGAPAAGGAGAAAAADEPAAVEEESEDESDEDMGMDLFG